MALYTVSQGATINALDIDQFYQLLTGSMSDQPVTVSNRIRAQLTGAVAAAGFVGGTASGAPVTGTFVVGDFSVDQTGAIWVCTGAGTPGTWIPVGTAGGGGSLTASSSKITGAGSPFSSTARCVGLLSSAGPPASGTWIAGDWGFDTAGAVWFCLTGGSPGTWVTTGPWLYDDQSPTGASMTIPATGSFPTTGYTRIRVSILRARTNSGNNNDNLTLRINGDTGANYDEEELQALGNSGAFIAQAMAGTSFLVGPIPGGANTAGFFANGEINIRDYAQSTYQKGIDARLQLANTSTQMDLWLNGGQWRGTAAATSLTLSVAAGTFVAGSRIITELLR